MAYRTAELPPVDLDTYDQLPFFTRMKILMDQLIVRKLKQT